MTAYAYQGILLLAYGSIAKFDHARVAIVLDWTNSSARLSINLLPVSLGHTPFNGCGYARQLQQLHEQLYLLSALTQCVFSLLCCFSSAARPVTFTDCRCLCAKLPLLHRVRREMWTHCHLKSTDLSPRLMWNQSHL